MNSLMKRSPRPMGFGLLSRDDPFDRLFDGLTFNLIRSPRFGDEVNGTFQPPVDITRDEHGITLRADLPGVHRDDIEITVQEDTLTLKGSRNQQTEKKEGQYEYIERRHGEFIRTFDLPMAVETDAVTADFDRGVLTIHLPVAETCKPRKIDIRKK